MPEEANDAARILIVEDEENARTGYEALLRKWGYTVLGVGTAEDALEGIPEFQPSLVIADVELPGMNGLELLSHLEDLQNVPAIVITGRGSDDRAVAAIEAGAFWYIEKPLKAPVLRALLERALGRVARPQTSGGAHAATARSGAAWEASSANRRRCAK